MRLFPAWAKELGLGDVQLVGCDLPIHAWPDQYRDVVQRIKSGEDERGALITTHKIDLFEACRDLFDGIDDSAALTGEASCLSKRDGLLWACATDPIAAGRSLSEFLPEDHWQKTSGEVLCLGAGGSAIAITLDLLKLPAGPARITVVNRSPARLEDEGGLRRELRSASQRQARSRLTARLVGHQRHRNGQGHPRLTHHGCGRIPRERIGLGAELSR
jgi:shikimate 5-dehydrogenase